MAAPLEKRFDQVIDLMPRVGEWIQEYAIPNGIHPKVLSYIMTRYNMTRGSEEISEMGYFYEEPEVGESHKDVFDQVGKTNDPRNWTKISDLMYNFENNLQNGVYNGFDVEDILKRTLNNRLRGEWADSFYEFCNRPVLSVEDIMDNNYTDDDLPKGINDNLTTIFSLISANEKQVKECRQFISKYCGPEYVATFDVYWAGKNPERMEKIVELSA